MIECKNMFYFPQINKIGGVESFYWYLVQKYENRDIVIIYRQSDEQQLARLRKYVRVFRFTETTQIKCEKAFYNYSTDIMSHVEAKEHIQILHGDYKALKVRPNVPEGITKLIGVSQWVCDTFHEVTGKDLERVYNPIIVPKPRKMLNLISATRLTKEKGRDRMERLADILSEHDVPFRWEVFTNDVLPFKNKNIILRETKLDIVDDIANADYLCQLSDTEGYCFSVVEALMLSKPVIVTDCPVFKEIGVVHGKNGFILDFDMRNVPVDEIYTGLKKFAYKPLEDSWGDVLAEGESQYKKDLQTMVKVRCTRPYYDLELKRQMKKGDIYETNLVRAEMIEEAHYGIRMEGGEHGTV